MTVSKDMSIGDILKIDGGIEKILLEHGMHCTQCPVARMETLAEACLGHGVDADALQAQINEYLANKA
ncbi:MAG TPA: DUF1858 domain-containing protein [Terriglobales bacterium]|nr:DUF1858 domain-containing protein [Candidatus Acidoferrum sp.]HWQ51216.1 DUF1858 domain-containing protein [Terriglobales bacterium]